MSVAIPRRRHKQPLVLRTRMCASNYRRPTRRWSCNLWLRNSGAQSPEKFASAIVRELLLPHLTHIMALDTKLACRYNWVAIQLLVFCYVISAIAAAAGSSSKAYGFVVVWTALLGIGYSVGGTLILRKINYRTPLAVGFMVGVGVMFVNSMLLVAVVSGANFARWGIGASPAAQQATEAFAILLFLAYVRANTGIPFLR